MRPWRMSTPKGLGKKGSPRILGGSRWSKGPQRDKSYTTAVSRSMTAPELAS